MTVLKKFRPLYLLVGVLAAALLAYGLWTRPSAQSADVEGFSSARVVEDIRVISKECHSVAPEHTEARSQVRDYLAGRLMELGADTLMRFRYDSLQGPDPELKKHVLYTFDAENLLAEFHPLNESDDTTYLMFVAHFDSRYSQPMPEGLVWSYGAADDGYGIGVTLETVSQLLKNRKDWKQGVKVLFTDAEEVGMEGMKAQWANDKEVFDNGEVKAYAVFDRQYTSKARKHLLPYVLHVEELNEYGKWIYFTETYDFTYGLGWVEFNFRTSDFAYEDNIDINPPAMEFDIVITYPQE